MAGSQNGRGREGAKAWAVAAGLVLLLLGATGYWVESAHAVPKPDEVGFGVPWSHELHARHPDFTCQTCHHESKQGDSRMAPCDGCHPRPPARPSAPLHRGDELPPSQRLCLHKSCVGCHEAVSQGPTDCEGCHAGNRGTERCGSCHDRTLAIVEEGPHKLVACAACHTGLEDNTVDGAHPRPVPMAGDRASCLVCHGEADGDPTGFPRKQLRAADLPEKVSADLAHAPDLARLRSQGETR